MSSGKSKQPLPQQPNPYAVAGAQTGSNVTTGIANSIMGNANETSPLGSTSTSISNYTSLTDPSTGQSYQIPTFSKTTSMSPGEQALYNQQNALGQQSNTIAGQQLDRVSGVLNSPVDSSNLPATYSSLGPRPDLQFANFQPTLRSDLGNPNAQQFDGSVDPTARTFADVGGPNRTLGPQDYETARKSVEDAMYSRLNPQLDRERSGLETNLVNQGFQRGTQAFTDAMDQFGRQANDQRTQVTLAGGQEQSRLAGLENNRFGLENQAQQQAYGQAKDRASFSNDAITQGLQNRVVGNQAANAAAGMFWDQNAQAAQFHNLTQQQTYDDYMNRLQQNNQVGQQNWNNLGVEAQYLNTARERALQEQLALRNQPLNEISTLMNGGQVTMPQFTQFRPGEVAPNTLGQNVYQGYATASGNYNAAQQANATERAGLYNLGGSIIGAGAKAGAGGGVIQGLFGSDRRLKRDIIRIGTGKEGLPFYAFVYVGDDRLHFGYMADEVEAVRPDAVIDVAGYKFVTPEFGATAT